MRIGWSNCGTNSRIADPALKVHIHAIDLSKHKSVTQLCDALAAKRSRPTLLINNAGVGDRGAFATSDFGRVNDMVQLNVVSLALLTRKLLPAMIAAKRGAILNVSSSASFLPIPGMAIYAATKAYVTSFSDALRGELRGRGITVTRALPRPGPHRVRFRRAAPRERRQTAPQFTYVRRNKWCARRWRESSTIARGLCPALS